MNFIKAPHTMRVLNVAFDVGSQTLNWSSEPGDQPVDGECENNSQAINKTLYHLRQLADNHGYGEIRILCESTGIYHRRLLQLAAGPQKDYQLSRDNMICAH